MRPSAVSSASTMDSDGPAGKPTSSTSATMRFAATTQGLPGPTILLFFECYACHRRWPRRPAPRQPCRPSRPLRFSRPPVSRHQPCLPRWRRDDRDILHAGDERRERSSSSSPKEGTLAARHVQRGGGDGMPAVAGKNARPHLFRKATSGFCASWKRRICRRQTRLPRRPAFPLPGKPHRTPPGCRQWRLQAHPPCRRLLAKRESACINPPSAPPSTIRRPAP